ncbi:MAG: PIN domain-containing protein [Candidatus Microthrix parvicella]|uniref:PIN domain-containing protein n=1 Tax=Candidatus Neomicrothrix sp. TaxID=2719034 RepID=UPI0016B3635A|nr:PIN domain-containing protein [Candidatus Microthrix sp.]MBL0203644.1 PIN domain-containing protein [Candidatus Microthrix sp.]MBP7995355.1 PIN domain-containing protein [Candidatus Microthrix sp.]NLH65762.1 PIN domain-containing protein [Candidatus Microthrix parvicella]
MSDWAALAGASNLVEPVSVCGQWPSAPGVVARVAPQAASRQPSCGEVREALMAGEAVLPGIVMQEALQTLSEGRVKDGIVAELEKLPLLVASRSDHRQATELYTTCRTRGVKVGTVDALIAGLCLRRDLGLLSADRDFEHMARFTELKLWRPDTVDQPE